MILWHWSIVGFLLSINCSFVYHKCNRNTFSTNLNINSFWYFFFEIHHSLMIYMQCPKQLIFTIMTCKEKIFLKVIRKILYNYTLEYKAGQFIEKLYQNILAIDHVLKKLGYIEWTESIFLSRYIVYLY